MRFEFCGVQPDRLPQRVLKPIVDAVLVIYGIAQAHGAKVNAAR